MMEKNHENIWIKKHNTQQFVEIDPILIDIYIYKDTENSAKY